MYKSLISLASATTVIQDSITSTAYKPSVLNKKKEFIMRKIKKKLSEIIDKDDEVTEVM